MSKDSIEDGSSYPYRGRPPKPTTQELRKRPHQTDHKVGFLRSTSDHRSSYKPLTTVLSERQRTRAMYGVSEESQSIRNRIASDFGCLESQTTQARGTPTPVSRPATFQTPDINSTQTKKNRTQLPGTYPQPDNGQKSGPASSISNQASASTNGRDTKVTSVTSLSDSKGKPSIFNTPPQLGKPHHPPFDTSYSISARLHPGVRNATNVVVTSNKKANTIAQYRRYTDALDGQISKLPTSQTLQKARILRDKHLPRMQMLYEDASPATNDHRSMAMKDLIDETTIYEPMKTVVRNLNDLAVEQATIREVEFIEKAEIVLRLNV